MVKVPLCKCCGHPIVADEIGVVLTPLQRRIFNIVKRAGTAGLTAHEIIIDLVYGSQPRGGPISRNVISVVCLQMNRRLVQFSVAIKASRGRHGVYMLHRLKASRWVHAKDAA